MASQGDTGDNGYKPTPLELAILRNLGNVKDEKDLSRLIGVDEDVISDKLDDLFEKGYVSERVRLTESGFNLLQRFDTQPTVSFGPLYSSEPASRQKGRTGAYATIVIVVLVLLLVFFVAPVVPYSSSTNLLFTQVTVQAQTSPSYAVFQCGLVVNPHYVGSSGAQAVTFTPWTGSRWVCGNIPMA